MHNVLLLKILLSEPVCSCTFCQTFVKEPALGGRVCEAQLSNTHKVYGEKQRVKYDQGCN